MKQKLPYTEWLVTSTFVLVIASLLLVTKVNAYRATATILAADLQKETFTVAIEGAVAKPGSYIVESGTTYREALSKAKPKAFANIKAFPLDEEICSDTTCTVEELKEIMITVQGAVEKPLEITLPARSRVSDLKVKVVLNDDADKGFFKSRRMLKDGEKIEIPKKAVE